MEKRGEYGLWLFVHTTFFADEFLIFCLLAVTRASEPSAFIFLFSRHKNYSSLHESVDYNTIHYMYQHTTMDRCSWVVRLSIRGTGCGLFFHGCDRRGYSQSKERIEMVLPGTSRESYCMYSTTYPCPRPSTVLSKPSAVYSTVRDFC